MDKTNQKVERKSSVKWWECAYCGIKVQNSGLCRPSVKFGGACKASPYGTHLFREK